SAAVHQTLNDGISVAASSYGDETERCNAGRSDAPRVQGSGMDPLSEALRSLPMSGCLIARAELRAPWGLGLDRFGAAVFHVMLSGSCWLDTGEGRPVRLVSGDIAVLMQGQAHRLISEPGVAITGFSDLVEHCVPGQFPAIGIDGGGAHASML